MFRNSVGQNGGVGMGVRSGVQEQSPMGAGDFAPEAESQCPKSAIIMLVQTLLKMLLVAL